METLSSKFCLKHPDGKDIYLFTLQNAKGTVVRITNYGAIITSFIVKMKDGSDNDIVLGFDNIEDYWSEVYLSKHPWFGCVVGRYANRIKNARFSLDGKEYFLTRNNGNEQLHGGIDGFDKKVWDIKNSGSNDTSYLELGYFSPDGEEGFPGNLTVSVRYELNNNDELTHEYHAFTDAPTPVNLTQHSYFNLDNGEGLVNEHELMIKSSRRLEQENNLVVNGKYIPVENSPYDFREFKKIGEGLKQVEEYDNSYVIDHPSSTRKPLLVAETRLPARGISLQVYSTEPVVHFYSGKWIPPVTGKRNIAYKPFSGFCLETHKHPNSVNVPQFTDTILRPGEEYYQKTIYKVIV